MKAQSAFFIIALVLALALAGFFAFKAYDKPKLSAEDKKILRTHLLENERARLMKDAEKARARRKTEQQRKLEEIRENYERVRAEEIQRAIDKKKVEERRIAGRLAARGGFATLLSLMDHAGITTLKSPGNYTIFAPSDTAFARLSKPRLSELQDPANRDMLKNLLAYHILNGNFLLKKVKGRKAAPNALQGEVLHIDGTAEPVTVEGVKITGSDIEPTNGTVYYLDSVLVPPGILHPPPEPEEE